MMCRLNGWWEGLSGKSTETKLWGCKGRRKVATFAWKCLNSLGLPRIGRLQTPAAREAFSEPPWREPMTSKAAPWSCVQRLGTVPRRKPDLHSGRQNRVGSVVRLTWRWQAWSVLALMQGYWTIWGIGDPTPISHNSINLEFSSLFLFFKNS